MIKCFKEKNQIENEVRKSRPTKLTKHYKKFTIRKIFKYSCLNAVKVIAKFKEKIFTLVSPETV